MRTENKTTNFALRGFLCTDHEISKRTEKIGQLEAISEQ